MTRISEKGNRQAKQQKKDERGQRNEKSQSVGKARFIKRRNLSKEKGGLECGSFEASEKSGMLQKKGRIWKNSFKRSGNQEKEEEDSPEKLGNKEEGQRRAERLLKEV